MKCYCYETASEFVLCAEQVAPEQVEGVKAAWFQEEAGRFVKVYPSTVEDKALISYNFERLGEAMLTNEGDWSVALASFAQKCKAHGIEWYITGSISEAARGVSIEPHDIDIVVHERDFYKVRDAFSECVVEPFVDNMGTWIVRYFGRLCLDGVMVDVVADASRNAESYSYERILWNGFPLLVESLEKRLAIERERERHDRICAIEAFMVRS